MIRKSFHTEYYDIIEKHSARIQSFLENDNVGKIHKIEVKSASYEYVTLFYYEPRKPGEPKHNLRFHFIFSTHEDYQEKHDDLCNDLIKEIGWDNIIFTSDDSTTHEFITCYVEQVHIEKPAPKPKAEKPIRSKKAVKKA